MMNVEIEENQFYLFIYYNGKVHRYRYIIHEDPEMNEIAIKSAMRHWEKLLRERLLPDGGYRLQTEGPTI